MWRRKISIGCIDESKRTVLYEFVQEPVCSAAYAGKVLRAEIVADREPVVRLLEKHAGSVLR